MGGFRQVLPTSAHPGILGIPTIICHDRLVRYPCHGGGMPWCFSFCPLIPPVNRLKIYLKIFDFLLAPFRYVSLVAYRHTHLLY